MTGGIVTAFSRAGESMTEALRCAEEYSILVNKHMAMDINDEDALEAAKQELDEKEKDPHEMGDYKTAKN
eukprot:5426179-Pyramimonas_sp.AAC.2